MASVGTPSGWTSSSRGQGVGREVPAPRLRVLVPRLAEYDDEREPITGLDGLLSGMPAAPFDSFYG
ncbi:hypothetical protein [Streptomyces sp. NBC_00648]|uniref:hypothetical protein n=1 Tax=Streptomyces sp. NBC_00648 TaxID=2975797 RepID=UPI0032490B4E